MIDPRKERAEFEESPMDMEYVIENYIIEPVIIDKEDYDDILLEEKPECPPYIERLHPYRKHKSHRKPNYWHRIRSNPRQR